MNLKEYMIGLNHDDRVIAEQTLTGYKKHLFEGIMSKLDEIYNDPDIKEYCHQTNLGNDPHPSCRVNRLFGERHFADYILQSYRLFPPRELYPNEREKYKEWFGAEEGNKLANDVEDGEAG